MVTIGFGLMLQPLSDMHRQYRRRAWNTSGTLDVALPFVEAIKQNSYILPHTADEVLTVLYWNSFFGTDWAKAVEVPTRLAGEII